MESMIVKEKPISRSASEIRALAKEYAIGVSPYPQDKGATYDTATYKAFEAGYRAALSHHQHGIRKERINADDVPTSTSHNN